jgi:hypothetical protein
VRWTAYCAAFFSTHRRKACGKERAGEKSSSKDIKLFTYNNTMADAAAPAPELKEYPEFPGQKLSKRYALLSSLLCCCCCRRYSNETKISSWFFPSSSLFFFERMCAHHRKAHPRAFSLSLSLSISFPHLSLSLLNKTHSEYKKMLKRQKAEEEKAAKAAAKVRFFSS